MCLFVFKYAATYGSRSGSAAPPSLPRSPQSNTAVIHCPPDPLSSFPYELDFLPSNAPDNTRLAILLGELSTFTSPGGLPPPAPAPPKHALHSLAGPADQRSSQATAPHETNHL
ncbi:hypothetical protein AAFF_G00165690 [Aldrovandia affinis]|uniref:Uncharacterized protein n=1 Tax=Aldrovandia affinis TaxID=143900 RepID=A0AAD7RMR0_9TELE|nr:hypothetical protein AAFF_G00165690 [Aldrovandia affinis]